MRMLMAAAVAALLVLQPATGRAEDDRATARNLVTEAQITVEDFYRDPDLTWFRQHVGEAKALLIVPQMLKGGFIFGGSGGSGVLLARNEGQQGWSYPAFYTLGSVTFGLQIGGEVSQLVLMIMTQKGLDAMLARSFKIGGDVSVAAGPVGKGAKAQTADIIAFSRTKGLYGGLNVEGAVVEVRDSLNTAYYGQDVRPLDILIRGKVSNPEADELRMAIAKGSK